MAAISTGQSIHFVSGAPRANYTGQIVLYSVNENGNVTVIQTHRGDQVNAIVPHGEVSFVKNWGMWGSWVGTALLCVWLCGVIFHRFTILRSSTTIPLRDREARV